MHAWPDGTRKNLCMGEQLSYFVHIHGRNNRVSQLAGPCRCFVVDLGLDHQPVCDLTCQGSRGQSARWGKPKIKQLGRCDVRSQRACAVSNQYDSCWDIATTWCYFSKSSGRIFFKSIVSRQVILLILRSVKSIPVSQKCSQG
jgi:hypothetical protein